MLKAFLFFFLIICPSFAFAAPPAASSTNSPGTMADDATVGTVAWTNFNNGMASDNAYAFATLRNKVSHYLKASNFGFSIPAGAVINGIVVEIERKAGGVSQIEDNSIKIVKSNGSLGTTEKSTGSAWNDWDSYITFGGSVDLWGETWTAADINDADFGVCISAKETFNITDQANIDHIRITVYYTPGPGAPFIKAHIGSGFLGAGRY